MNKEVKRIQIDKLTAAKRQLETSIQLFFNEADEISIHTLAAASFEILKDVAKSKNADTSTKHKLEEMINGDSILLKDFRAAWNKPQNFFKHANNDPEGIITFSSKFSTLMIFEAFNLYLNLTLKDFPWGVIFYNWFIVEYKEYFIKTNLELLKKIKKIERVAGDSKDKKAWLNLYLNLYEVQYEKDNYCKLFNHI